MENTQNRDVPNVASRLTSHAQPGEILISEETMSAGRLEPAKLEKRKLQVKGKKEKIITYALHL